MILAVMMLTIVFAFAAFTVDVGMITLTKGQIQNAADSAAHAAAYELSDGFGPGASVSDELAAARSRDVAAEMIERFRSGDLDSTPADAIRDVRLGRRSWDSSRQEWTDEWGVSPYNMAEVTVNRTAAANAELPLQFARVIGVSGHSLAAKSTAALFPGIGFELPASSTQTIDILPITMDLETWNRLIDQAHNGTSQGFRDSWKWSSEHGVTSGADGIPEVSMYPDLNTTAPPGNRGTVDLGSPNNSTNDLKRQIEFGLNAYDLSFFPNNQIVFDSQGALYLNGDTGISAGIEASLKKIVGKVRAIPIFISVSGPGNNATYTIVKFVGVRIMGVSLSGGPSKRHLTVQPAPFINSNVIRGKVPVTVDSILTTPVLIQ